MADIFQKLNMSNSDEAVVILKSIICENPMPCPIYGGKLEHLHKKQRKVIVIGLDKSEFMETYYE